MKITPAQLRRIIAEEVKRVRLGEALDVAQLADASEEELFETLGMVAERLVKLSKQGATVVKSASAKSPDQVPDVMGAQLEGIEYSLDELNKVVDAIREKSGM